MFVSFTQLRRRQSPKGPQDGFLNFFFTIRRADWETFLSLLVMGKPFFRYEINFETNLINEKIVKEDLTVLWVEKCYQLSSTALQLTFGDLGLES